MFELPSVLALFVEWDETAKNFSNKETFDILGVIEAARALKQRTMKVMVIVVHSGKIGIEYEEAVVNIKRRVEASDKNSSVSKLGIRWNASSVNSSPAAFSLEDFEGSVHRLEKQLMELSQQYYKDEAKRLKKELDLVNRRSHPQVCVRIHFKIAYLAEFRNDFASSIKYYTTSYNHLREVPKERDAPLEIKALADLTNFKLCKLYLVNGKGDLGINDAIVQFQKHARLYKQFFGPSKCFAEHWAWVSRQYQAMGELLERYAPQLKGGSVSSGFRHPIYYFESAATYAIQRKVHALKAGAELLQTDREAYAELKPIVLVSIAPNMEYIGRHITGKSDHPLEEGSARSLEDEMAQLRMAVARENNVDHSANIIRLLNKAYSFCDAHRNSRQAAHLEATLGAELFSAGQHLQAKRFFDIVIPKFRKENWWALLATVLRRSIVCALNLGDPFDYLDYGLELLQPRSPLTQHEKVALQANVIAAVLTPEEIRISPLNSSKVVNLETFDPHHSLITRSLRFEKPTVAQGSSVDVVLSVTLHLPQPISFSRLLLKFDQPRSIGFGSTKVTASALPFENSPAENLFDLKDTNHVEVESLILLPERAYTFRFRYHVPYSSSFVGKVECTRVALELGPEDKALALAWTPILTTSLPPQFVDPETQAQQQAITITPLNSTIITTPQSELEIVARHQPPALVSEFYRIDVTLRNKGKAVRDLTLQFTFRNLTQDGSSFFTGLPLAPIEPEGLPVRDGIAAGAEWATTIYAYSPGATPEREIVIDATYEAVGGKPMATRATVACPVVLPIAARCGFFSSSFASAADSAGSATLVADEECFVRVEVQSMCPYPIQVLSTILEIAPELGISKASTNIDMNSTIVLQEKEKLTTWFTVVPKLSANDQSLGVFNLSWKRAPHPQLPADYVGRDDRVVESPTLIPPLKVIQSPFSASIDVPSQGVTGRPLTLSLVVTNNTIRIEDFVLTVKDSEFFLCAGTMSSSFKVMPKSSYRLSYSLIPTAPGKIMVPHFQLVWKRVNKELQDTKQRRFVFVRPLIEDSAATATVAAASTGVIAV